MQYLKFDNRLGSRSCVLDFLDTSNHSCECIQVFLRLCEAVGLVASFAEPPG